MDTYALVTDSAAAAAFNRGVVEEFRARGGVVGGPFEGGTLLLLHSVGARSGRPHLTPLAYLPIDGRMFVVGSFAGAPRDPAWTHNVRAHPRAHIEIGTEAHDVDLRELPADERAAIYPRIVERAEVFAQYAARTRRVIPVFEVTPVRAGRALPEGPRSA
jgi:deazaflavin-dependent oxidoreductase (nitroreductase family)